ncbi:sulfurtransferase [Citricoccus sp. I39-566]|uniref:sulfurtransferase n=1 Tax=Citricoccus sp. I39-566 TaxID=3073268 RepID=UPI00286BB34B|nr:sulfurtransferase [Citricoccus sp. I39-566]WMY76969.1 sulfurtransferase [Citricoccus sp. I39-566]
MDRLTGQAPSGHPAPRTPVLVDVAVLAAWQGRSRPAAAQNEQDGQAGQDRPEGPGRGFVAAAPAPAADTLKVLDVRWTALGAVDGHEEYLRGHVPGAVYVSMNSQLAGHDGPREGRHPLPHPARFGDTVRMLGLNDEDTVVVYDDAHGTSAARAWWLLRHAGMESVYLLDGGLSAWRQANLPLQAGDVIPRPGTARTTWGQMPVLGLQDAAELPDQGLLLDARTAERYRGESEPLDPRAGHIPGAVSAPTLDNVDHTGRFRPADELRERFRQLGAHRAGAVGAYCGSGVSAAHEIAALHVAGIPAALYPGSWSAWSNTPGRPVATGERP